MAMPNEKKEKEVKQEKVEETKPIEAEKEEIEETKKTEQVETKEEPKNEEAVETKTEEAKEEEVKDEEEKPVVEEESNSAKGIAIEDLMTKQEFDEKMSAFEAKFEALVKENADLKEQNAQLLDGKNKAEAETENMRNKYERPDFGNVATKNIGNNGGTQSQYQSFDEYSKQFQ